MSGISWGKTVAKHNENGKKGKKKRHWHGFRYSQKTVATGCPLLHTRTDIHSPECIFGLLSTKHCEENDITFVVKISL